MKNLLCLVFMLLVFQLSAQLNIVPLPTEIKMLTGDFTLNDKTTIMYSGPCQQDAELFANWLSERSKVTYTIKPNDSEVTENFILFTCNRTAQRVTNNVTPDLPGNLEDRIAKQAPGEYSIMIAPQRIIVSSQLNMGVFYGSQTLKQMIPGAEYPNGFSLPVSLKGCKISDKPKFAHRGLLLDCCRHFMSKDYVMKYIDLLSFYKMNVLHWHLTEDQGWRIEIEKYPLLTEVGAWRTEADGSKYGGFYTKKDIREIVAYAASRHVEVIPEIEMPGHSCAAIAAYPSLSCNKEKIPVENEWGVFKDIYCAGNDETFVFLENVLTEVCDLFPSSYIHIGGDEAPKFRWEHCALCQKRISDLGLKNEAELQTYFIERIAMFLAAKGKKIIGWDEILEGGIPGDAMIQSWRGMEGGKHAALANHYVVMSPTSHCYFDYGLEATDLREVYGFNPIPDGLTTDQASFIRGGECNMWTEHAPQDQVDSKVFPRLLAMSEVLWTYPDARSYDEFEKRVEVHYNWLSSMNVDFGFPALPVTSEIIAEGDGKLKLTLVPNLKDVKIQYCLQRAYEESIDLPVYADYYEPLHVSSPTLVLLRVKFKDKIYPVDLSRIIDPHLGFAKPITLQYAPSEYYSGGGPKALSDGRIGSKNFRDGIWQAVQGENIEAVIDLQKTTEISSVSSNWFHYGNAWIFRPSHVEYYTSDDGKSWKLLTDVQNNIDEKTPGEFPIAYTAKVDKIQCRFVKMIGYNNGACPAWHDAPGEPSWLFCDEMIIH